MTAPQTFAMPRLGMGTWYMGDSSRSHAAEVAALRHGLDLGYELIDTAEMYGEGGAERVVGEAIAGRRDRVFLVSKVYPHNASRQGAIAACERSLKRLNCDYLDLYLLHWRGSVPYEETLEAFHRLHRDGKIRAAGVSNFDTDDMEEWWKLARRHAGVPLAASNQVLYNLSERGPEFDLLPWHRRHGVATMAYSPLNQAALLRSAALGKIAERIGATPAQLALAWLLTQDGVTAIPKSASPARLEENLAALELSLPAEVLAELDKAFPPPKRKQPLAMI